MLLANQDARSIDLARWLKNLTYKGMSFVIFGLPELRRTVAIYRELESRLYRQEPIRVFGVPATTADEVAAAITFLGELQGALEVDAEPRFASRQVAIPLLTASGSSLRTLMRIVMGAVYEARLQPGVAVRLEHFKAACAKADLRWVDEA